MALPEGLSNAACAAAQQSLKDSNFSNDMFSTRPAMFR